ncbi:M15 family metallopeptidase [Salipiger bermudensis]|uniref:Peptidase M15C domain-containing protein n=1 Tax=Salipiger bermudensis (strain DSM 26914 / JCM 13377 / KCTC 12554 / HTCC2601) TaxID=314265 RepID=Q0FH91_SALBH|nr:M15 family metallopeptidase [Salipiger bermudensis]EAU43560.1 hypothetical protein R2601_24065 [Salipiger bermudensis HTCC2601]
MDNKHVQMLLAEACYYAGAIDGVVGPKTLAGVAITERNAGGSSAGWSTERRLIAAAQRILNAQGYEAGVIDGYDGHNTGEALTEWLSAKMGVSSEVDRSYETEKEWPSDIPRQGDCAAYYGSPGTDVQRQLTKIELPFRLRIDWNLEQSVSVITVHEKCAPQLRAALIEVHDHYGIEAMRDLGIDRYAGAYNHRRMRGGSSWSMHAYGCAIDFYAAPNALRMNCPQALFCGPDYRDFLDIMEAHQWLPAIRLWGGDAMHFQRATL